MRLSRLPAAALGLFLLAAYPVLALTNTTGAPPKRTGAPGEQTCNTFACHDSYPLDSGPGRLVIEAPSSYRPGEAVTFRVRVEQDQIDRYGFQVAVMDNASQPVGTLEIVDPAQTGFALGNTDYVTHTASGSAVGVWEVRWRAPDVAVGAVTIYASGNAANGDGHQRDDYVYTTLHAMAPGSGTAAAHVPVTADFRLTGVYPNPASGHAAVTFVLDRPAPVTLSLYDALGRLMRSRELGMQPAGPIEAALFVEGLPAGRYFYEVRTPRARRAHPLAITPE